MNGCVYDFSIDYDAIAVDDIMVIHNYLMKKKKKKKWNIVLKFFGLLKIFFFTGLAFLSTLTSVNLLHCISMNNQECKGRPQIVNVNSDEPLFFLLGIKTTKCSGICNSINDSHA